MPHSANSPIQHTIKHTNIPYGQQNSPWPPRWRRRCSSPGACSRRRRCTAAPWNRSVGGCVMVLCYLCIHVGRLSYGLVYYARMLHDRYRRAPSYVEHTTPAINQLLDPTQPQELRTARLAAGGGGTTSPTNSPSLQQPQQQEQQQQYSPSSASVASGFVLGPGARTLGSGV